KPARPSGSSKSARPAPFGSKPNPQTMRASSVGVDALLGGRPADFLGVIVHQRLADRGRLEAIGSDFRDRRYFRGRAGEEAFLEARQFVARDGTLMHRDLTRLGQRDYRAARDAVQEAI